MYNIQFIQLTIGLCYLICIIYLFSEKMYIQIYLLKYFFKIYQYFFIQVLNKLISIIYINYLILCIKYIVYNYITSSHIIYYGN